MSAYESKPDPMLAIADRLARIEAALRAAAGANGAESLVITGPDGITAYDPDTGSRLQYSQGRLWFWDNFDENPENPGLIMVDPGAGTNMLRMFPPYSDGDGNDNSITVQGRRPGEAGHIWLYSDGRVDIISPLLGLYELPTTSATANVALTMVGGQWTLALVTSSNRYKANVEPADITAAAVLAVEVVQYNDRIDMDVDGYPAPTRYGVLAEQAHEHVPQFVPLDDEGLPNAFDYDRFAAVGHQVVLKDHENRLVALEADNADLRAALAELTARLEALGGDQ